MSTRVSRSVSGSEISPYFGVDSSAAIQEQNWENGCISGTVQRINTGLAPLCC